MEAFDVFPGLDEVANVRVMLGPKDGVVDDDAVNVRIGVRGRDGVLSTETRDVPEVEGDADVIASLLRVVRVGLRRPVIRREEAGEHERMSERGDLGAYLRAEAARDLGRIENESHERHVLETW